MKGLTFAALAMICVLSVGWAQQEASPPSSATTTETPQSIDVPDVWDNDLVPMGGCFMCSKSSTGACKGAEQCKGSRSDCRKKGCKISGTRSCSTAANVKTC